MLKKAYRKIRNQWNPEIFREIFVNGLAASVLLPRILRYKLYKVYGISFSKAAINPRCVFWSSNVKLGSGSFVNYGCFFANHHNAGVEIGDNCAVGMEVMFCNYTHEIGDSSKRAGTTLTLPIKVGNGCWIGTRAIINPGITIGEGCVIAAGAVVTKDCEPNGLYAGVPAKRIKDLS